MSSEVRKIREQLRKIAGSGIQAVHITAEVTEVTDKDCTIKIGDLEIPGVLLFSTGNSGAMMIRPKKNTMVTVADLSGGELRDLVLIKVDDPEVIRYNLNGLAVEIDGVSKKVDVSNTVTSLSKLMEAIYDIISKLTVSTPNGPSGTPLPPTIASLEKFKMDFQQLLK